MSQAATKTRPTEIPITREKRFAVIDRRGAEPDAPKVVPEDSRTLTFSFSSELPVQRWFGREILSHDAGAPDLSRLNDGAPLLFNHDPDDVIGVVEKAWIAEDKRGYGTVRFAKTARAQEVVDMVNDGILRNVSFAYEASKYRADVDDPDDDGDTDNDTYTATSWKAYELSLVSIPADNTVGIGRSESSARAPATVERTSPAAQKAQTPSGEIMSQESQGGAAAGAPTIDINAIRAEALASETARIREIEGIAARFNLSSAEVAAFVSSGKTVDQVKGLVLEKLSAAGAKPVADYQRGIDLSAKEQRSYSFVKAIRAQMTKDWSEAGLEREVATELAKHQETKQGGLLVPMNLPFVPDETHLRAYRANMQQRATYQVGTAVQGGNLVATNLLAADFIEVLRNASVTAQLGARWLTGLVGKVSIPRQTSQTGLYWVGESAAVTESEATFDQVNLSPKTAGSLSKISRLMLLQSTPAIEMIVREDLVRVMALGIDSAVMLGSGASGQPTGIVNQSGVGAVVGGTNGANITFDNMIQLYSQPRIANAPQANLAFAFNAKVYGYLSTLKATTGTYLWMPQGGITVSPGDSIMGHPYAVSNQLPYNLTKGTSSGICSEVIFGNWREVLVGSWGALELLVNPYDSTGFTTGDVIIRALQTIDVGVRHAASFAVMTDALTPGF